MTDFLKILAATIAIDLTYLKLVGEKSFRPAIEAVQGGPMRIRGVAGFAVYAFIALLLYKFAKTPLNAFLLGLCVYGVFDATNYAIFSRYPLAVAVQDALWGGVLFALVRLVVSRA